MPHLQIIVGSTRPVRVGRSIADWFESAAKEHGGFTVELVDLAEVGLPFYDEPHHPAESRYVHQHTKDWSARISAGDAFVFVSPEYNNGFAAPLKNALDFLYSEWFHKPAGFVSYGMSSAGLRAAQMIKPVLTTLGMMPVGDVIIPLRQYTDSDGQFQPTDKLASGAHELLDNLLEVTAAFAPLRAS